MNPFDSVLHFKVPSTYKFHNQYMDVAWTKDDVNEYSGFTGEEGKYHDRVLVDRLAGLFTRFNNQDIKIRTLLERTSRQDWKGFHIYSEEFAFQKDKEAKLYKNYLDLDIWAMKERNQFPIPPLYVYKARCLMDPIYYTGFVRDHTRWIDSLSTSSTGETPVTVSIDRQAVAANVPANWYLDGRITDLSSITVQVPTAVWEKIAKNPGKKEVKLHKLWARKSDAGDITIFEYDYFRLIIDLLKRPIHNTTEDTAFKSQLQVLAQFDWPYARSLKEVGGKAVGSLLKDCLPNELHIPWHILKMLELAELNCVGLSKDLLVTATGKRSPYDNLANALPEIQGSDFHISRSKILLGYLDRKTRYFDNLLGILKARGEEAS